MNRELASRLLENVAKAFSAYVLAFAVLLPVHEFGHYWAATALGYGSTIHGARTCVPLADPASGAFRVILLSGGGLAGLVMVFLYATGKTPYRYGFLAWAIEEFLYAPMDGQSWGHYPSGVAIGVGIAVALLGLWRETRRTVPHGLPAETVLRPPLADSSVPGRDPGASSLRNRLPRIDRSGPSAPAMGALRPRSVGAGRGARPREATRRGPFVSPQYFGRALPWSPPRRRGVR